MSLWWLVLIVPAVLVVGAVIWIWWTTRNVR